MIVIGGPCVIEDNEGNPCWKIASELKKFCDALGIDYYFKASFDKANRTSIASYRGIPLSEARAIFLKLKEEFDVQITTDIHLPSQSSIIAEFADVIQIPAFLCRQTDLLIAAAETGKTINVKKGQFLSAKDVRHIQGKVNAAGNDCLWITERGNSFGYNNLVVDMRNFFYMKRLKVPLIIDCTHSAQLPGGGTHKSSGDRRIAEVLGRAGIAAGADGIFLECHPDPNYAKCDAANSLSLERAKNLIATCKKIFDILHHDRDREKKTCYIPMGYS